MRGIRRIPSRGFLHARAIPAGIAVLLAHLGGGGLPQALAFPPYPGSAPIKSASPVEVAPGAEITWTIAVVNDFGDGDLAVSLLDDVPDPTDALPVQAFDIGTLTAPATAISSYDGDTLSVSNVFVPPGQTVTLSFRSRVRNSAADTTSLCNEAVLHYVVSVCAPACSDEEFDTTTRPPGGTVAAPTCAVVRAPTSGPDLRDVTKGVADEDGDALGSPGELLTWTITVPNTGGATARNVLVTDAVDPSFVVVDTGGGALSPGPPESVSWPLGDLAAGGTRTLTLTTRVACDSAASVGCNGAMVTADTLGPLPTDDTATWALDDATCLALAAPALELRKLVADENGDGLFVPGETLHWTVAVRNVGTAIARQVSLDDALPSGLAVIDAGGATLLPGPPDSLTFVVGDIAPGESLAWAFTTLLGDLPDSTFVSNQASASSPRLLACGSPVMSDDPGTAPPDATSFVVARPAIGALTKSVVDEDADGLFEPGELLTWNIAVESAGSAPLAATLSDVLAPGQVLVDPGGATVVAGASTSLTWPLAAPAGGAAQRTFTTRIACDAAAGAVLCNQAQCAAPLSGSRVSDDPTTAAPDDATCVTVSRPDLSASTRIVSELIPDGLFLQGEGIRITVRIDNAGNAPATGIVVTETLDPMLTLTDPGTAVVVLGPPVRLQWTLPLLPAGGFVDLVYTAQILPSAPDGAIARGQALAESAEGATCGIEWQTDDPSTPFPDDANIFTIGSVAPLDLLRERIGRLDPVTPPLLSVLSPQCEGPTSCHTCALTTSSTSTIALSGLPGSGTVLLDGEGLNGVALIFYQLSGGGRCLAVTRADGDGDGVLDDILLGW